MKAVFKDFIVQNPTCKKFEGNAEAEHIFKEILSKDKNIYDMILAARSDKPALSGCITEIEAYYDSSGAKEFDLTDRFTRQALGRMVKTVLDVFGYRPAEQKDMPRALKTKYVASGHTYKRTGTPKMKIVITSEEY